MSKDTALIERRKAMEIAAKEIDEIAGSAMELFGQAKGSLAQELQVAQAMVDMRALLTNEMMQPIMALMNTDLGFRTDRDPKTAKEPVTPYSVDVVREVFIESKLRGFHTVGNEFNIIAGRFYGAQNGFKRLVREKTAGSYEPSIDPPVFSPDGKQARVKCRARWKLGSKEQSIGIEANDPCEFIIRVNAFMGADGIVGKADRRLAKRVFERITGQTVPDAEVSDLAEGAVETTATVTQAAAPKFGQTGAVPGDWSGTAGRVSSAEGGAPAPVAAPAKEKAPEAKQEAKAEAKPEAKAAPAAEGGGRQEATMTPQQWIAQALEGEGVTFRKFIKWVGDTERIPDADSIPSWDELPTAFCVSFMANAKEINKCIIRCKA